MGDSDGKVNTSNFCVQDKPESGAENMAKYIVKTTAKSEKISRGFATKSK